MKIKSHSTVDLQNMLLYFCFKSQSHIDPVTNCSMNSFQPSLATLTRKKKKKLTCDEHLLPPQTKFRKAIFGFSKQHKK